MKKSGQYRYGIAEWYGKSFTSLSPAQLRTFASPGRTRFDCPFRDGACSKTGGVCSMRLYLKDDRKVIPHDNTIVTMCPSRFVQQNTVFSWIGGELIGTDNPVVIRELPFLLSQGGQTKTVGKIDMVLVNPASSNPMNWCALEMQAVYFSGMSMSTDFKALANWDKKGTFFPLKHRRPDFRSSGPKRLMPQLQTKVPTISRWGKKTAVVVDKPFWNSLGTMPETRHISNGDIIWFVVDYEERGDSFQLIADSVHSTTLENAVTGLTGGTPTSLPMFETEIRKRMERLVNR